MRSMHSHDAASRVWFALMAIGVLVVPFAATLALAAEPLSFDRQLAPLLTRRCLSCHSGSQLKVGLDLSSHASTIAGGESDEPIVAGDPDASLLWQRVDEDEMPPKHPLSNDEKTRIRCWIAEGAQWGTDPIDPFRFSSDDRAGYDWWALQPVEVPEVRLAAKRMGSVCLNETRIGGTDAGRTGLTPFAITPVVL